jgi:hypothetical protein
VLREVDGIAGVEMRLYGGVVGDDETISILDDFNDNFEIVELIEFDFYFAL